MVPEDLKNSEELKSTEKDDLIKSEEKVAKKTSTKKEDKKATTKTNDKTEPVKSKSVDKKTEEKTSKAEKKETTEEKNSAIKETQKPDVVEEKKKDVTTTEKPKSDNDKKEPEVEFKKEPVADAKEEKKETQDKKPAKEVTAETKETAGEKSTDEETIELKEAVVEKLTEDEKIETKEDSAEISTETEVGKSDDMAEKKQVEKDTVESKEVVAEKAVEKEEKETKETEAEKPAEEIVAEKKETADEKKVDKESESTAIREEKKQKTDYTNFSQVELVNAMRDVLDNHENYNVREELENIKSAFYKNLNEEIAKAKQKFIEEGGEEKDFVAEKDPYENDIKDLLKRYRQIRYENNKRLDQEKEENLKLKYQVIEDIKNLINKEESINKTFQEFRELQNKWREIGLVPQSKMKNLWDTYHFHVENFYNYIKINRELRDLDLKKNFEAKIKLCEQAEELLVEPSIIKAFNTLQKYHERWREIGPVPHEHKDDIWERFKAATSKINKKHQEFFENRKEEQKKNLEAKTALCDKVEAINIDEIDNHREWDEKSKQLIELQKVWRTIGFAPKKDNNKIYERFRTACDKFFDAKREFYSKNKELQQNNLQLKIDLCVQAEALKDSTDWRKTTQDFINIQKKWKEIGPVPRKQSDIVWKRFRSACDFFFEKKAEHFSEIDSEQVTNLKAKESLIEEITAFEPSTNVDENLKRLKDFQRRWTEIGHVPFKKKDEIQVKYRDAINKLFDVLNIDEEKRNLLKFRSKISTFSESSRGQNKMRFERDKYMNKLKQLENDLVLLDNNIGFFAESKNAESLIKDVQKKIENTKQKIETLKNKIRVIDEMDKSDN